MTPERYIELNYQGAHNPELIKRFAETAVRLAREEARREEEISSYKHVITMAMIDIENAKEEIQQAKARIQQIENEAKEKEQKP
jgi:multidrug resistance efflux pump